jgi:hypothetical protein
MLSAMGLAVILVSAGLCVAALAALLCLHANASAPEETQLARKET